MIGKSVINRSDKKILMKGIRIKTTRLGKFRTFGYMLIVVAFPANTSTAIFPGISFPGYLTTACYNRIPVPGVSANAFSDTASPSFLIISDIHLNDEGDQSPAITKNSDTGKDLWDSARTKINSVLSGGAGVARPKFIVYLGDLPWHAKDSTQVPDVMKNAGKVLSDLRILAEQNHVPLIFVPGNNDSGEGDYGPFSNKLFDEDPAGAKYWPVIGSFPIDTSAWSLGCYSVSPLKKPGSLLVLVLNTNIFTPRYGRMTGKNRQTADANRELKWLGRQLRTAAAQHRKILIAMHVPPGKDGYLPADSNRETCTGKFKDLWDPSIRVQSIHKPTDGGTTNAQNGQTPGNGDEQTATAQNVFLDLVGAYRHSIVGILGSHTHFDGIRLLMDRKKDSTGSETISSLLISAPGIAPGHGNNPGFKIVRYDPSNFQWNDFITFYNDFYPSRTVKTWGDLSFGFKNVFHVTTKGSMLDQLRQMPVDNLRNYVNSIYTLYNGDGYGKGNCVDTTLFVHGQP
jgi:sphingomyelin phosphodiesterase acid-like 3